MRRFFALGVLSLVACGDAKEAATSAKPTAKPEASNTIVILPTGVSGAPPLTGAPAACEAFHKCCDEAQKKGTEGLGLTCGLAHAAAKGQCEEALELVRSIITEQKQIAPPGCL